VHHKQKATDKESGDKIRGTTKKPRIFDARKYI
jgi:hypothetical protein